jgi:SAM-dependent methyltransferase
MLTNPTRRPTEASRARTARGARTLIVILALGAGLSLMLYIHGAWWWYAPAAVLAIVLAHMAILGGIIFAATHVHGGTTCCQQGVGRSHQGESLLLHGPRQFDLLARLMTLGRERKLRQWTLDLANLQPENQVLDVGCGTGTLLLAAAERVGPASALHGVEPAPEMAAHARHKAQARRVQLEVVQASADSLPYPPASFDAVFCTLVFHHLPRSMQGDAVRETRRVLRPGGRVVIVDWQRPKSLARALASPLFLVYLMHNLGPGRSPLDVPGIEALMKELGFEAVARWSFGAGGAVGAVVGRLPSGTRAIDQADPHDITHVRRSLTAGGFDMGRRKLVADDELLAVAHEVFVEKGIAVPTREIARQAGISEAVITSGTRLRRIFSSPPWSLRRRTWKTCSPRQRTVSASWSSSRASPSA